MKIIKLILLTFLFMLILAGLENPAFARREKTTISKLKLRADPMNIKSGEEISTIDYLHEDTLKATEQDLDRFLSLAGYDKPLTASRETIHATNHMSDSTISSLSMLIIYLDYLNRELHRRQVDLNIDLPAGQTQLISFPTWDLQRSFYYRKSTRPRRSAAPYDIRINLISICAHPDSITIIQE